MPDLSFLQLPFFDDRHAQLAADVDRWARAHLSDLPHGLDIDAACRARVRALGEAGWLRHAVPAAHGGITSQIESRALCILRQTLSWHDALTDFAFAMQGLGSGAIALHGSPVMQARYLPRVAAGEWIAAFALSEQDAGSDVAAMTCAARREGSHYVLDGGKTWISNGGIADFYTVVARTGEGPGARGLSAFVVDANTPGLEIAQRIDVMAPHPLATLRFAGCRVPAEQLLGTPGAGFKVAMQTLDIFRTSVAAAAIGLAQRALDETVAHVNARAMFGSTLGAMQLTQATVADMATQIESAILLTYRAAWMRDVQGVRTTKEAAMAKMVATEGAQRVIDAAVQAYGGRGVRQGEIVERLYREIRPLRIYEGATEVQKLIIAREILRSQNQ